MFKLSVAQTYLKTALISVVWATSFGINAVLAAELAPEEQRLLPLMNEKTVADVIAITSNVKDWQEKIKQYQSEANQTTDAINSLAEDSNANQVINTVLEIANAIAPLTQQSSELDQYLTYTDKIKPIVDRLEREWQSVPFDSEAEIDLNEDEFRNELKELSAALRCIGTARFVRQWHFAKSRKPETAG